MIKLVIYILIIYLKKEKIKLMEKKLFNQEIKWITKTMKN